MTKDEVFYISLNYESKLSMVNIVSGSFLSKK